jgi:hypothetical protein
VLPGTRFRDHPRLAHALRQQRLTQRVVDLVRARMGQVLPLQEDPHRTGAARG